MLAIDFVVVHIDEVVSSFLLHEDTANWAEALTVVNHCHVVIFNTNCSSVMADSTELCALVGGEV